jgi:hypothetical protein
VARGKAGLLKFWSVVLLVLGVVILGLLALYAKNVPVALSSVDEALKGGLQKAILKTCLQGVLYPVAFLWTGWRGWKHATTA